MLNLPASCRTEQTLRLRMAWHPPPMYAVAYSYTSRRVVICCATRKKHPNIPTSTKQPAPGSHAKSLSSALLATSVMAMMRRSSSCPFHLTTCTYHPVHRCCARARAHTTMIALRLVVCWRDADRHARPGMWASVSCESEPPLRKACACKGLLSRALALTRCRLPSMASSQNAPCRPPSIHLRSSAARAAQSAAPPPPPRKRLD